VRVREAILRHGVRGVCAKALAEVRKQVRLAETHVWYALDLTTARPRPVLEEGLTLRKGTTDDVSVMHQMEMGTVSTLGRLRAGNDWWIVLDEDVPLFSCWIFRDRAPVLAAPAGRLELAPGRVCLEDSVTSGAARGRGIAPAAWALIADALADEGQAEMITKVGIENAASRRAVTKAGFEEVAIMHFVRSGPRRKTTVEVLDPLRGQPLQAAIANSSRWRVRSPR
jgi:predicted GNAT family acetyltransferase